MLLLHTSLVGEDLLKALENGVSKYPTKEGRFPLVIKQFVINHLCIVFIHSYTYITTYTCMCVQVDMYVHAYSVHTYEDMYYMYVCTTMLYIHIITYMHTVKPAAT